MGYSIQSRREPVTTPGSSSSGYLNDLEFYGRPERQARNAVDRESDSVLSNTSCSKSEAPSATFCG
jgi:hypothetical protein